MGWGALMGLGNGLQQVGGMLEDMNKREFAEKLAREREDRAEQREKDREARRELLERQKVSTTTADPSRGVNVLRNSFGDVIREEPMTANELAQIDRDSRKEEASLRSVLAKAQSDEFAAGNLAEDREMERQLHRARLGQISASTAASNRSNRERSLADSVANVGTGEKVNQLMAANKTLVDDLTKGTENSPADFTVGEITELADAARRAAIDQGKDVNQTFQILMRREQARRRAARDAADNGR